MLNVIYDLRAGGTEADIARIMKSIRDECESLDTIASDVFTIRDIAKFRYSRRRASRWEKEKEKFASRHEQKWLAADFFRSATARDVKKGDKTAVGLAVYIGGGSECMNIVLVNNKADESRWTSRRGYLKDQYAEDFADAHQTICEILKFMDGLGIVDRVDDRFEYYGKWDWEHALDKWQELTVQVLDIGKRMLKKDGDFVDIGGRWRLTKDGAVEEGYSVADMEKSG